MGRDYDNDNAAELGVGLPSRIKYTEAEKPGVRAQKVRLGRRASIGKDWDGKADNDNIAWPLAKALLAEDNGELLKYALAYRKLYDAAKSDTLIGVKGSASHGLAVVHRSHVDEVSGRVVYGPELVSRASADDIPPTMARPTNPDSKQKSQPVPKAWTGDRPINDAIDARAKLAWLQGLLGAAREPFELACIDGATLQEVGNSTGIANRAGAMGAGRALCHVALITLRDALGASVRRKDAA